MDCIGKIGLSNIYKHGNKYYTMTVVPTKETEEEILNPSGIIFNEIKNIDLINKIKVLLDNENIYNKIVIKNKLNKFRIVITFKNYYYNIDNIENNTIYYIKYSIQIKYLFWWITIRTITDEHCNDKEKRYNQIIDLYNNIIKDYGTV